MKDEFGRVISYLDQQEDMARQSALDYLEGLAAKFRTDNLDLHVTCDVRLGAPTEGILMAESDGAADLVVMATHGRTGLPRAFIGSVAGEVIRDGRAPVLLLPPHALVAQPVSHTPAARYASRGASSNS